jgi:hypothetical protein
MEQAWVCRWVEEVKNMAAEISKKTFRFNLHSKQWELESDRNKRWELASLVMVELIKKADFKEGDPEKIANAAFYMADCMIAKMNQK